VARVPLESSWLATSYGIAPACGHCMGSRASGKVGHSGLRRAVSFFNRDGCGCAVWRGINRALSIRRSAGVNGHGTFPLTVQSNAGLTAELALAPPLGTPSTGQESSNNCSENSWPTGMFPYRHEIFRNSILELGLVGQQDPALGGHNRRQRRAPGESFGISQTRNTVLRDLLSLSVGSVPGCG